MNLSKFNKINYVLIVTMIIAIIFSYIMNRITANQLKTIDKLTKKYESNIAYIHLLEHEINELVSEKVYEIDEEFIVPDKDSIRFIAINPREKKGFEKFYTNIWSKIVEFFNSDSTEENDNTNEDTGK